MTRPTAPAGPPRLTPPRLPGRRRLSLAGWCWPLGARARRAGRGPAGRRSLARYHAAAPLEELPARPRRRHHRQGTRTGRRPMRRRRRADPGLRQRGPCPHRRHIRFAAPTPPTARRHRTFSGGGPGRTDARRPAVGAPTMKDVAARYDVVGIDPFVGRSTPLDCHWPTGSMIRRPAPAAAPARPHGRLLRRPRRALPHHAGDLLPHAGTRNTARGMDVIHAAQDLLPGLLLRQLPQPGLRDDVPPARRPGRPGQRGGPRALRSPGCCALEEQANRRPAQLGRLGRRAPPRDGRAGAHPERRAGRRAQSARPPPAHAARSGRAEWTMRAARPRLQRTLARTTPAHGDFAEAVQDLRRAARAGRHPVPVRRRRP